MGKPADPTMYRIAYELITQKEKKKKIKKREPFEPQ
jgi:hypothetical protein